MSYLGRHIHIIKKRLFIPGSIIVAIKSSNFIIGRNIERGMKYRVVSARDNGLLFIENYDGTPIGGLWSASRFAIAKESYV